MTCRNKDLHLSKTFKVVYVVFTVTIILLLTWNIWGAKFGYPMHKDLSHFIDLILFPVWTAFMGYRAGVQRTLRKLNQRWK